MLVGVVLDGGLSVGLLYLISGILGLSAIVLADSGSLRALLLLACVLVVILVGGLLKNNSDKNN